MQNEALAAKAYANPFGFAVEYGLDTLPRQALQRAQDEAQVICRPLKFRHKGQSSYLVASYCHCRYLRLRSRSRRRYLTHQQCLPSRYTVHGRVRGRQGGSKEGSETAGCCSSSGDCIVKRKS
jgi:hypothetical protein